MLEWTPLTALLGPTNTGKTHRAVERMLEHESGMIGLPLRLLAREVYDRVSARIGEARVALVTGEEKRIPENPRYWVCTVEAMPIERAVDFVAIDEVQLAAHRERGHVFTDRLLNARGRVETWFLGSDTMRPLFSELLPDAELRRHPRLSKLHAAGSMTLGQLPPRSAVVAFSMARVYEIAERLRARRGGAAVVLGALSPRARNAQVAMYQAREVDHMVATDAIGMGLNLDLEHVAFADLIKFDGREARDLSPAELAQIAGRAGRYTTDGSFGALAPLGELPKRLVRAIERHEFSPERRLVWRNADLDFSSLNSLLGSLRQPPRLPNLSLVEQADDFSALCVLARQDDVRARATGPDSVRLLWDTCQIPDYRALMPEAHARLVADVFLQLSGSSGRIARDWLLARVTRLDDESGDIDTLLGRMAFVRTWTYVSSHPGWVDDALEWQTATRAIEDRLSDALHARLVERFVDRARPAHRRRIAARANAPAAGPFAKLGELYEEVERASSPASAAVVSQDEFWEALGDAPHARFEVDAFGRIRADAIVVGKLVSGADLLRPEVKVVCDDAVGAGARSRLARRLLAFARDLVEQLLAPLRNGATEELTPAARGLCYQLEQGLGCVLLDSAREQVDRLSERDRRSLEELGIAIGQFVVHLPALLKPRAIEHRAALWNARAEAEHALSPPPRSAVSLRLPAPCSKDSMRGYLALGYPVVAQRAVRADVAERAAVRVATGPLDPAALDELSRWLGCPRRELPRLLEALGAKESPPEIRRRRRRRRSSRAAGA